MVTNLFLLLLLATGCAFACAYYFRTPKAWLLIGLRAAMVLACIVALVEPAIRFERFETRQNIIPVLVDVSESMRLFRPDSSVVPFLRSLSDLKKNNPHDNVNVKLYCFGDSLRPCASPESIVFSDKQSLLPLSFPEKAAVASPLCVIVSDAHFSNASLPRGLFSDKTCLYYTLGPASSRPFLVPEIISVKDNVEADSPSVAVVHVRGFTSHAGVLQLTCREKSGVVARTAIRTQGGFFSDTAVLHLPSSRQGRFLYTVTIVSPADTIKGVLYFTQTVVSGAFTARILSSAPSLDRRFLSIGLKNDPQWTLAHGAAGEKCDALFIFDDDGPKADAVKTLAPGGIVVFLGSAGCAAGTVMTPSSFSLVTYEPYDTLFSRFIGADLPPPSRLFRCSPPVLSHQRSLLGCLVPRTRANGNGQRDTIPFLSLGTFERHAAISIPGQDLWRLDFWPLALTKQSETASFLQHLVAFVKQQIVMNASGGFMAYPSTPILYENDSIPFTVLLPSGTEDENRYSARFFIDSLSRVVASIGPFKIDFKEHFRGSVQLPPMASGTYRYRCIVESRGVKREFNDSLHLCPNREESSVSGQNTVLLGQLGLPLQSNSVKSVLDAYSAASPSKRSIVADTFELRKSWPLLSVILVLLTLEWLVRRQRNLE